MAESKVFCCFPSLLLLPVLSLLFPLIPNCQIMFGIWQPQTTAHGLITLDADYDGGRLKEGKRYLQLVSTSPSTVWCGGKSRCQRPLSDQLANHRRQDTVRDDGRETVGRQTTLLILWILITSTCKN